MNNLKPLDMTKEFSINNNKGDVSLHINGKHLSPISFHPVTGVKIQPTDIHDMLEDLNVILFNPWSGEKRESTDINNDLLGCKSILPKHKTGFESIVYDIRHNKPSSEILENFEKMELSPNYIYGKYRFSFLMFLVYHGYEDLFFKFFNLSSNADHRSIHGETIFHISTRYPEILRFLLNTGSYKDVDINYPSQQNNAIIIASANIDSLSPVKNRMESIRMLVDAGGDINHRNIHGRTALMSAASSGDYEFVKFILSLGADKTIKDNDGFDAKHYSCMYANRKFPLDL